MGALDRGGESQEAVMQPDREMPKKLLSQLLRKHRLQHQNNKGTTPDPKSCLLVQRHRTVIEDCAQLQIWFLPESQIGTFKVRENRPLSPGRQPAPSWQSLLPVHSRGSHFAAALVKLEPHQASLCRLDLSVSCCSPCEVV